MLDCSNNLRTAYLNILNGNITYNGKDVPVYGNDSFETTPQNYVIITDIVETADNNNQNFTTNSVVSIDIFSEQYLKRDNSIVDNISNQILNILMPTTKLQDIGDTYFQIFPIERSSSTYLTLNEGNNYIVRKIITINNLVNQK
jgi:hypothetical protein